MTSNSFTCYLRVISDFICHSEIINFHKGPALYYDRSINICKYIIFIICLIHSSNYCAIFTFTINAILSISISDSFIPFSSALTVASSNLFICSIDKVIFLSSSLSPACLENFKPCVAFCCNIF